MPRCIIILKDKVLAELPAHPWGWTTSTVLFCPHKGEVWARFFMPDVQDLWVAEYWSSPGTPSRHSSEIPGSFIWSYHSEIPRFFTRALIERELLIHADYLRKQGVLP